MPITLRKVGKALIFVLTIALFALFILFDTYSWGKFAFLGLSALILLLGAGMNHGKIAFRFTPYVLMNILFIGFVLLSSLWAINFSDSAVMARTLFRVFICAYAMYITYLHTPELNETVLLKAVMWAGYIVAIYSLTFYGLDEIIAAGSDANLRVDSGFANVNTIGLACALSCVIQMNLRSLRPKDHFFPSAFFMIPSVVIIAATQSRKALVFLIAGILGYAVVKAQESRKNILVKIGKILLGVFVLGLAAYWILQLDLFNGIRERMESMLNAVSGNGRVDHSTILRNQLKDLGLEWFLKYPVGGVGIGNPHILASQYYSFDAYLHDNFVELLCGGGLMGFCLYYAIYVYLFRQLWKYRKVDPQRVAFFALWLGLMLAMNYGMVTYYSKDQNFYLMIHFVNVENLKRKSREQQYANNKICESATQVCNGQKLSVFDKCKQR